MMELFTKKLNNRKGFTLIELIVVIAIIGILAAILIPQFGGFSEKAKAKASLAEARSVATAVDALIAEGNSSTAPLKADVAKLAGVPAANITLPSSTTMSTDGAFTYKSSPGGITVVRGTDGVIK